MDMRTAYADHLQTHAGGGLAVCTETRPGVRPWPCGGLPGELEIDPLIQRDMLLCGLQSQGAMELFRHPEAQNSTKMALTQRRWNLRALLFPGLKHLAHDDCNFLQCGLGRCPMGSKEGKFRHTAYTDLVSSDYITV